MERKDYILTEIEKIGVILTAIKQKLLGGKENSAKSKEYLEKVLQLYTISNLKSKTYSLEREMHIMEIKNAL